MRLIAPIFILISALIQIPAAAQNTAVERGLTYFRTRFEKGIVPGDGAYKNHSAVTALVGMAFLSSGSTPEGGPDAEVVKECVRLVLAQVRPDGAIAPSGASSQSMVYAHGFAATFLAECLGMSENDDEIRKVLQNAVRIIVNAQNSDGGWRYSFTPDEEDVSVTACMLVALRACKNAGLAVPAETVERGIAYLKKCQNPDGGFRYRLMEGPSAYPRSVAAVAGLCAAGEYGGTEINNAFRYALPFRPGSGKYDTRDGYYFYAQYYAAQAYWLCADDAAWEAWYPAMVQELERTQKPDGSWTSTVSIDHATAMALIILQIPNNYLPIFQK